GIAVRLQRRGVHDQRRGVLLERVQLAAIDPGVGVGGTADPALDRFVIREGVAVSAEQRPAGGAFQLPLVGPGPALAKVALPVVEVEAGDHAVAVEGDIVAQSRRELRVRLYPEKRAIQLPGNCAFVRQIYNVGLDARGRVEAGKTGRPGKVGHCRSLSAAIFVSYTNNPMPGRPMPKKETIAITTPHVAGDEDIGEIRNIVGFHIRLAHGAVYRHFTETFAELDLTQKQVSALWLVDDHPDIAQTGLAQRMRMDRATTMAIVNRLEAKGYLVRRKSRSDGRKQALNLTDRGRKALSMAKRAIHQHEQWLKSRFTEKEVTKLIELLA